MFKTIENKIRFNVVLIYIIVIVVCIGMIFLIFRSATIVDSEKKNIEKYFIELSRTNELINKVNLAQSVANLFMITKRYNNLQQFRECVYEVEMLMDTLSVMEEDSSRNNILMEISDLLKQKGIIVSELNIQFNDQNPLDSIKEKLRKYEPVISKDSFIVTSITHDTVINLSKVEKKNFWRRLANVFSPEVKPDTLISVTTHITDTLSVIRSDSTNVFSEISGVAEQASIDYINRISEIEKQVSNLIIADQEISSKISNLLIDLYSNLIHSRFDEIENSEEFIRKSNLISIISISVVLLLILTFIIFIINNVNKAYKLRMALVQANERTKEIMESRHTLLLSVSHDIKTPLNSILGYLELNEKCKEFSVKEISAMQNSGKHILALLENLLEFSSLEQGTLTISDNNFNLWEISNEIVEMFSPLALQKHLSFSYDFGFDKDLFIYSDKLKIKQIIINLLSNSIKYTISGRVNFSIIYNNNELELTVADTGVGIPEEQLDIIFKPFSRIEKNSKIAGGSGFGMFVVKGLVDLLNGEINIESVIDKGTKISITIPADQVSCINDKSLKKILLIDDDPVFLKMIWDLFTKLGHTVTMCNTISDFEELKKGIDGFDIVVTDMEMGSISGLEVLYKIREIKSNIPVIIMTGRSDFNAEIAKEMGFSGYLEKPVTKSSAFHLIGGREDFFNSVLLDRMFENDLDTIRQILDEFVIANKNNITFLGQSLLTRDFKEVQSICHKMLPMYMQIGVESNIISILKKIDSVRYEKNVQFDEWEKHIVKIIDNSEELIKNIQDKYFKD